MADSDVIGGIENLTDAVSGETPSYEYKNPNTDMMKAISKCIDAADGTIGSEYHYDNPNTDVIQKMDELADAIATHSGGGSSILITKTITENKTYKALDDSADGYSEVTVNVPAVQPTLITKSITENGTYDASDDSADGYSSVTVDVESGSKQVSYLKWKITKLRGIPHANAIQMAEFYLYQSGNLYTWNANASVTADLQPVSQSETANRLIDGTEYKYCSTQWGNSQTGECNIVFSLGETITIDGNTSYAYRTAGDEISRDPIAWTMYGSSDGTNWEVLDTVNDADIPTNRLVTTPKFVIPMGGSNNIKLPSYSLEQSMGGQWFNTGIDTTQYNSLLFVSTVDYIEDIRRSVNVSDIIVVNSGTSDNYTEVFSEEEIGKMFICHIYNDELWVGYNASGTRGKIVFIYS